MRVHGHRDTRVRIDRLLNQHATDHLRSVLHREAVMSHFVLMGLAPTRLAGGVIARTSTGVLIACARLTLRLMSPINATIR